MGIAGQQRQKCYKLNDTEKNLEDKELAEMNELGDILDILVEKRKSIAVI